MGEKKITVLISANEITPLNRYINIILFQVCYSDYSDPVTLHYPLDNPSDSTQRS